MNTLAMEPTRLRAPPWLWAAGLVGILWNAYGAYQFVDSFTQSAQSLMSAGMTKAQAELYLALPTWISVVFAIGVFGGLLGSIALVLRKRMALPIFAVSLVGYAMLFAGDTYYGVFAAIPAQLLILAIVVVMAAALLVVARLAIRRGLLH